MTEKDFTSDLIRGLKAQGCYAEKWPDLARAVVKPFDICCGYQGHFYPMECKLREFYGQEMLPGKTIVLSPADFRRRKHQLPGLLKMVERQQAKPYIAAFIVLHREMKQPIKKGWIIPAECVGSHETWTLQELLLNNNRWGLVWVPKIGWTVPWLPEPDANRLKEEDDGG